MGVGTVPICRRLLALLVVTSVGWATFGFVSAQSKGRQEARVFADADAVHLIDAMRRALEENNRGRLLKMFDGARMPGFATFRDQLTQFLEQNQAIQVQYQVTQVSQDGEYGAILTEFVLEAAPAVIGGPTLRRRAQMRLVTAWDGKSWKIVDLTPRNLFQ